MKRIGFLRAGMPACLFGLGVAVAACGGTDNAGIGSDPDAGAGGDGAVNVDGGGGNDGSGGGDGGVTDGGGDGGGGDGGVGDAADGGVVMGPGTYVSGIVGLDTNPGTKALPVKTISKGITNAVALGGTPNVYVAQGHYPEKVALVEGISVLGGYQCDMNSCTWVRDRVVYDTAIDMQDNEGVLAGASITKRTTLDGFRLRGKTGAANAGVVACLTLDGGSPTVTNNVVSPGDVTGNARAIGIQVIAPTVDRTGALIDSNAIQGGTSTLRWIGISFDFKQGAPAGASVAVVSNNRIRGGAAQFTTGIAAASCGATTTFFKNDILAGTSTAPGAGNGTSWAIEAFGSKATYDSNSLNADQANTGTCSSSALCGGFASYSSTSILTNNVIVGVKGPRTTGLLLSEAELAAGVIVANGNYIDGAGSGPLVSAQSLSSAIQLRNCNGGNCGVNTIIGKIRNNILMGGLNTLRYGVYEEQLAGKTCHPQAFEYNDIFFSAQANRVDTLYHFWNNATATDLATTALIVSTVPTNPAPTNLYNVDPQVNATRHLVTPGSPMIDKGTATEAPPKDIDGDTRPRGNAVDIGADEAM